MQPRPPHSNRPPTWTPPQPQHEYTRAGRESKARRQTFQYIAFAVAGGALFASGMICSTIGDVRVETAGDSTTMRPPPAAVWAPAIHAAVALVAAAASLLVAPIRRQIRGGWLALAVIAALLAADAYDNARNIVLVTPDYFEVCEDGLLINSAPRAIRFDEIDAIVSVRSTGRGRRRYEVCRFKTGAQVTLDFGPARPHAWNYVAAAARAKGVRVDTRI